MGLVGKVVSGVVSLLLVVAGLGAYLYFTDYGVKATITDKGRDEKGPWVDVTPRIFPTDYRQHLDASSWDYVCVGYQVVFHVQSQKYTVFDAEGDEVYDSDRGLVNPGSAIRCRVGNGGGGGLLVGTPRNP